MTNMSGANLHNGTAVGPQGEGSDSPSRFSTYPAYKDSGVEWLGSVPAHWVLTPIKHLALLNPRKSGFAGDVEQLCSFVPMEKLKTGVVQLDEERPIDEVIGGYTYFEDGDVLQAKVTPCFENKNVAIAKGLTNRIGFGSSEINVLRAYQGVNADYLYYRVQEDSYMSVCTSSMIGAGGLKRVPTDVINNFKIAAPTLCEQTQIARFLDHETARIDALIDEQQRLIELLKEKRQAVISHAVTKGLDPTVPMKESEISYLDKSPIHWRLKRLGDVVAFAQGKAHEPYIDDDGDFICVNSRFVSTEGKTQKYCSVNLTPASVNDILMVMSDLPNGRALARAYYVIENGRLAVNQRVCRITAEQANSRFLFYLLNRHPGLMQNDDGVNQTHLSNSDFQKLRIFLPPLSEQLKIAHYLDHVTVRIDSLISEAVIGVGLLQERRSALISAAVTGKIDVRGWQPPASTQTPEFEVAEAH
ncbi:restriction endonuclease subunit S [Ectopseudomonas oleovorans]|uniref:restriction endonuclease subunit S n=1 Tax=Ectopseudomonas oleovorans TaxID=301 RepID=UPI000CF18FDE|nr:restriction endonuclease subunit S [Pseudomonas oleovorans]PPV34242.1 restriction endonuclease subunit S [Pseudomonas oleovorans]